jgi:hypothetical protein
MRSRRGEIPAPEARHSEDIVGLGTNDAIGSPGSQFKKFLSMAISQVQISAREVRNR